MIKFDDGNNFELSVMDLMDAYSDKLKTAEAVQDFSDDLHQHLEIAIQDMLLDGFNGIDPDDYEPAY